MTVTQEIGAGLLPFIVLAWIVAIARGQVRHWLPPSAGGLAGRDRR